MVESFEKIKQHIEQAKKEGTKDVASILRKLDPRQRLILTLFQKSHVITSKDVEKFFNINPRTARELCRHWVQENFLVISDPSKKSRKYILSPELDKLLY